MQVKIVNTSDNPTPEYKSKSAAGFDIAAQINNENAWVVIEPYNQKLIGTGLSFEIPEGYYLQLKSRSGLASKQNLHVGAGVIDSDFRGEIKILLINQGEAAQTIRHGDRIAQGIIIPYVQAEFETVTKLSETVRGDGGFGSTGIVNEVSKSVIQQRTDIEVSSGVKRGIDVGLLKNGDKVYLRGEGFYRIVDYIIPFEDRDDLFDVVFWGYLSRIRYYKNGMTDLFAHNDDIMSVNGIQVKEQ